MAGNLNSVPELDYFVKIKDLLIKLHYPNFSFMKEEEIIDILSTPNRKFLIKWIFTQMEESYSTLSDLELAELVVNYGFCLKSKSARFISGDLPIPEQFRILCNLLGLAFTVKSTVKLVPEEDFISIDDLLNNVVKTDTNLFPKNGPKLVLTVHDRKAKIEEFKKTIIHLEELCNDNNKNVVDENVDVYEDSNENVKNSMNNLLAELEEFGKRTIEYTKKSTEANFGIDQPKLMSEDESLKKCRNLTTLIKKYLENIDTLVHLKDREALVNLPEHLISTNKNSRLMVKALSDACKEFHELNLI